MSVRRLTLLGLVLLGLWGSGSLAWHEWSEREACPAVGPIPACYIAFAGYLAMVAGLTLIGRFTWARRLFLAGLVPVGGLALVGSIRELVQADVCPKTGAVPMCYLSLGFSIVIGVLLWKADRGTPRA